MVNIIDFLGLAFWVEIVTDKPRCTYYFGPFHSKQEAEESSAGYIEDLQQEGSQCICVEIKRCKPSNLTVYDEFGELISHQKIS